MKEDGETDMRLALEALSAAVSEAEETPYAPKVVHRLLEASRAVLAVARQEQLDVLRKVSTSFEVGDKVRLLKAFEQPRGIAMFPAGTPGRVVRITEEEVTMHVARVAQSGQWIEIGCCVSVAPSALRRE